MSSEPDGFAAAVHLGRALRSAGLPIGPDRVEQFVRAAAACGDLYWAGRVTLVSSPAQIEVYDRVYFGAEPAEESPAAKPGVRAEGEDGADGSAGEGDPDGMGASHIEILRHRPFDQLTDQEIAELAAAVERIRRRSRRVPERRLRPSGHGRIDLPRTVRDMQRHGGEMVPPKRLVRRLRTQRVTFCVDVSGSMAAASRAVLLACAGFIRAADEHEAFAFGTRLTRITSALKSGPIEQSLDWAEGLLEDMHRGTRIGESLEQLLSGYRSTRVLRGANVVIYSDGLERGEPDFLAAQMEHLARLARRVVWLNPHSAAASYEPLTAGMLAVLPWVELSPGDSLATFEQAVLSALDHRRRTPVHDDV